MDLFWSLIQPLRYLRQNISNLVYARQDCASGFNREFFWRELNVGWYEMREQFGIVDNYTTTDGEVTV